MESNYIIEFSKRYTEFHRSIRVTEKWLNEYIDKILVWILSLSTGSIVLLISSVDKITFANKNSLNGIIISLGLSVTAGVIGRILYGRTIYLNNELSESLESSMIALQLPYHPFTLRGDETSEEIYLMIKDSFNLDLPIIVEQVKGIDNSQRGPYDENARRMYERLKVNVKEEQEYALNKIFTEMNKALGIKELNSNIKEIDERNYRKRKVSTLLENWSYSLFAISAISFLIALTISVISYVTSS